MSAATMPTIRALASTEQAAAETGLSRWALAQGARDGSIPPGVVVRVGRRVLWNVPRLWEWIEQGGELANEGGSR